MSSSPDIPENELRERSLTILSAAADEARRLGHDYIGTEHLFIAISKNKDGHTSLLLQRAGLNPMTVRNSIRREVGSGDGGHLSVLPLTPRSSMVLSLAVFLAEQEGHHETQERHVLLALLQEGEGIAVRKLVELGFDLNHWLQKLLLESAENLSIHGNLESSGFGDFSDSFHIESSAEVAMSDNQSIPTPLLDKYGRDLIKQAANGKISRVFAREREIRAVARTLARSKKNNPLLLGDAGVGKTAVVEGLAYAIFAGEAPTNLLSKRIVEIEIGTLVAGTSLRGQFEERLLGIVSEASRSGNVILFIDEIHTIVGAGDTIDSNLDAANILKPALARGELMCIGATTHEEYRKAIAQDPALERRFRTIDVEEPDQEAAIHILTGQRQRLTNHHGITILDEAIEAAVKLSMRYLTDRRLPDKALDLLDEACTRITIRTFAVDETDNFNDEVTAQDIAAVLSEWTGIPVSEMTQADRERYTNLENSLRSRVIGQEDAVDTVAAIIKAGRAGLNDPNRPLGVFLFLGPSGVGKTELAHAIAENLFGTADAILRLDMSEFHDSHTVSRLIGAPPGYRDTSQGGQLTEGLRRRPYTVVLLDEVEKAAPEVFDIFLQVFDEGRLSDANGRPVDARHAVFIMTSNIGTQEGGKRLGFGGSLSNKRDYTMYLSQFFRPEFLNRLDEVITFNALTRETLEKILQLQLRDLYERLAEQGLTLSLTPEARELILELGYDPERGARPLRRTIDRMITRPISNLLISNQFSNGDTILAQAAPEHQEDDLHRLVFVKQETP
ncbi:MAG: ATP-dependent Clp protease ATP-binding subunit [Phototrophicaceae bacterium]